jgi:hypothetical protein
VALIFSASKGTFFNMISLATQIIPKPTNEATIETGFDQSGP